MITFKQAEKKAVKLKMSIAGPSGSGKTLSALMIAYGLTDDLSKIVVVDTENKSSQLYEDIGVKWLDGAPGKYYTTDMQAPYTTDKYIEYILACEKEGFEVCIIDSMTHEWAGSGGILEQVDVIKATGNNRNDLSPWAKLTPAHNRCIDAILQSNMHVIVTLRSKEEVVPQKDEQTGKMKVVKLGLAPIMRDGFAFEMTIAFDMDVNNLATCDKDRTSMFKKMPPFTPSVETGRIIKEWCNSGNDDLLLAINDFKACDSPASYDEMFKRHSPLMDNDSVKRAAETALERIKEAEKQEKMRLKAEEDAKVLEKGLAFAKAELKKIPKYETTVQCTTSFTTLKDMGLMTAPMLKEHPTLKEYYDAIIKRKAELVPSESKATEAAAA